ncbi:MAG TPA: LacI family DNA-binding transcriptional regulator [Candidatus Methylacidiphilales bacterium]
MTRGRVTLRDVALEAGVHLATVSRALRNDKRLAPATIAKIRATAGRMGYVPDPMLSGLAAYRSLKGKPSFQSTLAWITNHFTRDGWRKDFDLYYQGASERAARLGYRLEAFWLRERGMTGKRMTQILRTRNISGLIVAPQPRTKMRIRLSWEFFSAVAMGYTLAWPRLHLVTNDQFDAMSQIVRQLRAHGYRRIGLAMHSRYDARINHGWTGAFLAARELWPEREQLPIFSYSRFDPELFAQWLRAHRPEAVVGEGWLGGEIRKLGYDIPGDIGLATYGRPASEEMADYSGADENFVLTGARAVDLVVGMIHLGERGIPQVPQRLLTEGVWRDGTTLRFVHRDAVKPPARRRTGK